MKYNKTILIIMMFLIIGSINVLSFNTQNGDYWGANSTFVSSNTLFNGNDANGFYCMTFVPNKTSSLYKNFSYLNVGYVGTTNFTWSINNMLNSTTPNPNNILSETYPFSASNFTLNNTWVTFSFKNYSTLNASAMYGLCFTGVGSNYIKLNTTTSNIYPNGTMWAWANRAVPTAVYYPAGGGSTYDFNFIIGYEETTTISNFTITSLNNYNSSTLQTFNATVINGGINTYTTTIGTITTNILSNYTGLVNITVNAPNQFSNTSYNINVSSATFQSKLDQYPIIILQNKWNQTNLTTSQIIINSTIYNTTNTNIYAPYNNGTILNTTTNTTNYINTIQAINYTKNTLQTINVSQSIINLTVKELYTNNPITNFSINITGKGIVCNTTTQDSCLIYPNNGSYTINNIIDNLNQDVYTLTNNTFNVNYLDQYQQIIYVNQHFINITANDTRTNATITTFGINIQSQNTSDNRNYNTTSGSILIPVIHNTYNITITSALAHSIYNNGIQVNTQQTINSSTQGTINYTFSLQPENTIDITIKDENTNNILNQTVLVTLINTNNLTETSNTTTTGYLTFQGLTPTNYTLRFQSSLYSTREYPITVGNSTYQTLTAYLGTNTTTTIFTTTNTLTGETIEGVACSLTRTINSTPTLLAVYTTDITGRFQINYITDTIYSFSCSKTGYETKTFQLNPILFTEYTIKMNPTTTQVDTQDYSGININYAPKEYNNNQNTTINFTFISPQGKLTLYGFNATYKTTTVQANATNTIGAQLQATIPITNANIYDQITITYYYQTTDGQDKTYTYNYPIQNTTTTWTITSNKNQTYGLGIFERILILTILIMIFAGGISYFAGPTTGGIMAIIITAYFTKIGFINEYLAALIIIPITILLLTRLTE